MKGALLREALASSLHREGGVVAALCGPALILVFGVLGPLGLLPARVMSADHLTRLFGWPTRIVFLGVAALIFFHAAHRARFLFRDLGAANAPRAVAWLCYASALVLILWSVRVLVSIP